MRDLSSQSNLCPVCGCALPSVPGGLCPRCLMAQLVAPTQAGAGGAAAREPWAIAELAPSFPQLEIMECLGRGGMGVVYKARQKSLDRMVALKLIAPERAGDADFARRFEQEARALAALQHPHIVAVYDFGQAGGCCFLLMEYVNGVNLRQLLQSRRLTAAEALSIVPPVCEALQCAHAAGIVHRDIKPENLLLDRRGVVKIADFGVAKILAQQSDAASAPEHDLALERTTLAFGSADYAAPEQRDAAALDHRADIYSLGVVLYEMLTGERPGERWELPSRRAQVDVRIDEIVHRALQRAPDLRFATAAEFGTRVEAVRQSPVSPRFWSTPRKAGAGIAAGLAVAAVAAAIMPGAPRDTPAANSRPSAAAAPEPQTLEAANAELDRVFTALLDARKAEALETTTGAPPDATRSRRMEELQQRMEHLQNLMSTLPDHRPAISTPP